MANELAKKANDVTVMITNRSIRKQQDDKRNRGAAHKIPPLSVAVPTDHAMKCWRGRPLRVLPWCSQEVVAQAGRVLPSADKDFFGARRVAVSGQGEKGPLGLVLELQEVGTDVLHCRSRAAGIGKEIAQIRERRCGAFIQAGCPELL
jgi:hypothetical protein